MNLFSNMLSPLSIEDFTQKILFKEPFAAPEKATEIRNIFNWNVATEIIQSRYGKSFFAKNGKVSEEPAPLCMDRFYRGITEGKTLVIPHAENAHSTFAALAHQFTQYYPRPVDVELYLTPEGNEGLDWHYDYEDVFVLQSSGVKEFILRKNSFWPKAADRQISQQTLWPQEKFTGEIRCTLQAGDWLYIPAGYWHKARALTKSYHVSVGLLFDHSKNDAIF
ncbi:JmjC domain-containing protein [Bdellovibrio sp. HCB185ZH]|uniref:JmjC domain-containing protein n=1 Tax=Bdellovibrio sp. HCB185ZH TaxID=3394235 RepID=UPI0039A5B46D